MNQIKQEIIVAKSILKNIFEQDERLNKLRHFSDLKLGRAERELKQLDDLIIINNMETPNLEQEIKILELVYFCQNGRYPDEQH